MNTETNQEDEQAEIDLMSLAGSIKPKVQGVSVEDMDEAIAEAAASMPP